MSQSEICSHSILKLQNNSREKLMIFELSYGGHYPEYIAHLIRYWYKNSLRGNLMIIVSPQFLQRHPEVVKLAKEEAENSVHFLPITSEEEERLSIANTTSKRIIRAFQEFKLVCKYSRTVQASHVLFTYFDSRQFPLALGQKLPCACSGIYFRPRFHYSNLTEDRIDWREQLARWQEKLLLAATFKNPQLKCIFSLDPFVIKYFPVSSRVKVVALPDPVEIDSNLIIDREQLKASLGIEPQRKVFLLFGGLTKRKGILPLLDALTLLPAELGQKICLLLVGSISEQFKHKIQPKIAAVAQGNLVQIISEYRYVTETETQQYFQLADVVLALYQRHIGMSGIIIRAAAAQKPVISSNYGLMGEITRRYQLGLPLDSSKPQEVAEGIKHLLVKSPGELIDGDRARQFAQQNSPFNFASTIFHHLGLTHSNVMTNRLSSII